MTKHFQGLSCLTLKAAGHALKVLFNKISVLLVIQRSRKGDKLLSSYEGN